MRIWLRLKLLQQQTLIEIVHEYILIDLLDILESSNICSEIFKKWASVAEIKQGRRLRVALKSQVTE